MALLKSYKRRENSVAKGLTSGCTNIVNKGKIKRWRKVVQKEGLIQWQELWKENEEVWFGSGPRFYLQDC